MKKIKGLLISNNQIVGITKEILKIEILEKLKITDQEFEDNYSFIFEIVKNFFEVQNKIVNSNEYYIIERDNRDRLIPVLKSIKNSNFILDQYVLSGLHNDLVGDIFLDSEHFVDFEVNKNDVNEKVYNQMFARREIFKFINNSYTKHKNNESDLKSIYISGTREIGKTFLINLLTNSLIRDLNKKVAFIDIVLFVNNIIKTFETNNSDEIKENILESLVDVDLLVLDNIGREKFANWFHSDLMWKIITSRINKNKQTIFLSNFNIKNNELEKKYLSSRKESFNNDYFIKNEVNDFIDLIKTATSSQIDIVGENIRKFLKKV